MHEIPSRKGERARVILHSVTGGEANQTTGACVAVRDLSRQANPTVESESQVGLGRFS